jgi:hypothetical protein
MGAPHLGEARPQEDHRLSHIDAHEHLPRQRSHADKAPASGKRVQSSETQELENGGDQPSRCLETRSSGPLKGKRLTYDVTNVLSACGDQSVAWCTFIREVQRVARGAIKFRFTLLVAGLCVQLMEYMALVAAPQSISLAMRRSLRNHGVLALKAGSAGRLSGVGAFVPRLRGYLQKNHSISMVLNVTSIVPRSNGTPAWVSLLTYLLRHRPSPDVP